MSKDYLPPDSLGLDNIDIIDPYSCDDSLRKMHYKEPLNPSMRV